MKKLLSILGSVAITATSASAVVSCTDSSYIQDALGPSKGIEATHEYDESEIQASLLARAKTLILNNQFGLSDAITKPAVMKQTLADLNVNNNKIKDLTVNDIFSKFINDSSIGDVNPNLNMNGTIGDSGGIAEKIEQSIMDAITNAISSDASSMIHKLLVGILNAQGFNNLIGEGKLGQALTDAAAPILQVLGQLNTPTAMTGIPYALTLIPPTLQKYGTLTSLASKLIAMLGQYKDKFDGLLKPFIDATDLTSMASSSLSDIQGLIANALEDFIPGPKDSDGNPTGKNMKGNKLSTQDAIGDVMKLISLGGYYLTFFNNGTNDKDYKISDESTFAEMSATKTLSDSVFYKTNQGKGFNIAPILKAGAYFLAEDNHDVLQSKVRKLLQILLISSDKSVTSSPKLSALGTLAQNMLAKIIKNVPADSIGKFIVTILTDKAVGTKLFNDVFNDWYKLADDNVLPGLKDSLDKSTDLKRAFYNDTTYQESTYSLNNLLQVPLYKILLLAKSDGFYSNGTPDQLGDTDLDTTGLLPSFAGAFTQSSIVQIAKEAKSIFKMDDTLTNNDVSYYYFLFGGKSQSGNFADDPSSLNKFIDELLFNDPYNGNNEGVLSEIVDWIAKPNAWKEVAIKLGYLKDADGNLDKTRVNKKSIMGDILMMLIPKLTADIKGDTISLDDVIGHANSDDLTFFASGLSSFMGDILKPTNYDYWLGVMLRANDLFSVDNSGAGPWIDRLGFTEDKFANNGYIKDMTLKVEFDFSKLDDLLGPDAPKGSHASLIDLIPLNYSKHPRTKWTFTISRDDFTQAFTFTNIKKG